MEIGYARVSTGEQTLDLQLDALNAAGCGKVYTETASGAKADRPVLDEVLAKERLVHESLVREVPGMRMLFVDIANAREKAAALEDEAGSQAKGSKPGLLDFDLALCLDRQCNLPIEVRVDGRRCNQFRVADVEAAPCAVVMASLQKAGDMAIWNVLAGPVPTLQDD